MGGNPWIPLLIAFIIQSLAFLPLIAMPETLTREIGTSLVEGDLSSDIAEAQSRQTPFTSTVQAISTRARYARESMSFLSRDISLCILVGSFFLNRFGLTVWSIMLNYVSKRYDWLIREVCLVSCLIPNPTLTLFRRSASSLPSTKLSSLCSCLSSSPGSPRLPFAICTWHRT